MKRFLIVECNKDLDILESGIFFYCYKYNGHYEMNHVSNAEVGNHLGDITFRMAFVII